MKRLLLFDLDGTLLRTDKTISERTFTAIENSKKKGYLIGISTSRSETNCTAFLGRLEPDILITSGGALIKKGEDYIFKEVFSPERTLELIHAARKICGENVEITIDTVDKHYWNYKVDSHTVDKSWGDSVWTDFRDFHEEALKMCVEILDEKKAGELAGVLKDCDSVRFSDSFWYKFTKKNVTKEHAVKVICDYCQISMDDMIAFGDDYADIGMLQMAGIGIAMGNATYEVKEAADLVIDTNDNDGIAIYLDNEL